MAIPDVVISAVPLLTRDAILSARDLLVERVEVPEWGGAVLVRTFSGKARDEFEEGCFIGRGKDRVENYANLRARLVALAVVDEAGVPLFSAADVDALGGKSAAALDRVFSAAQRLNGIGAADVEALVKNSEPSRGGATSSD